MHSGGYQHAKEVQEHIHWLERLNSELSLEKGRVSLEHLSQRIKVPTMWWKQAACKILERTAINFPIKFISWNNKRLVLKISLKVLLLNILCVKKNFVVIKMVDKAFENILTDCKILDYISKLNLFITSTDFCCTMASVHDAKDDSCVYFMTFYDNQNWQENDLMTSKWTQPKLYDISLVLLFCEGHARRLPNIITIDKSWLLLMTADAEISGKKI